MSWGIGSLRIWLGAGFVHELQHHLHPNWLRPRRRSGRFLGAVGRATFPLEVHEVQQVACCPRIAQRTVVRLEFDTVKLAQLPETVRFVSGVAPTHSGDGA